MKFTVDVKDFLAACVEVSKAITNKTSFPALMGIKLDLRDNVLTLSGYDMEIGIETKLPVISEEDGAVVTCNAKLFIAALQKMKGEISVEVDNNNIVHIKANRKSTVDLAGNDVESYPALPEVDYDNEISGDLLSTALNSVNFAIDENSAKEPFKGALLKIADNTADIVGVNGCIIAKYTAGCTAKKANCIIPKAAIGSIAALAGKNEKIKFGTTRGQLFFGTDSTKIITRVLAGDFFNYGTVEQKMTNGYTDVTIIKSAFIGALELASVLLTERERTPVVLTFRRSGVNVKMESSLGKTEENIPCEWNGNSELKIGFNAKYMIDALKQCAGENVTFRLSTAVEPTKIDDGTGYSAVVMPIRLNNK